VTRPAFLISVGLILVGLAGLEFSRAMATSAIKLRGGARITRARSPRIFWINVAFQIAVAFGGAALILWGLSRE
jgi:hypothetical protein